MLTTKTSRADLLHTLRQLANAANLAGDMFTYHNLMATRDGVRDGSVSFKHARQLALELEKHNV